MSGETNLDRLLATMSPQLQEGKYVFLTSHSFSAEIQRDAVMLFREVEGVTAVVREELTQTLESDTPRWALITLTVHSDLNVVGFLAAITKKLAEEGISVNAVSAYYHDHLFVPWEKREKAMNILHTFNN